MGGSENEAVDPLHRRSGPDTAWTRVNIGEGIPGVCTPLNWSWRDDTQERTIRGAYYDMGVLSRIEIPDPNDAERRASSIFYGRPALNVDVSRALADMQPGTSGDALEELYFGAVRADVTSVKSRRRYPAIFLRSAPLWAGIHRRVDELYEQTRSLWRGVLDAPAPLDIAEAQAGFFAAHRQFEAVTRPHSVLALLVGALSRQLTALATRADQAKAALDVLGGHDSIELETTRDMQDLAAGRLSMAEFLRRHGSQGPAPGEISSHPWREDPGPVERVAVALSSGGSAPAHGPEQTAERRVEAERKILSGLSGWRRIAARLLIGRAHAMMPARETGKAAMMLAVDMGRFHARGVGRSLAEAGRLSDPEDVFYLTMDELGGAPGPDLGERVARRRAQRAHYESLELPRSWVGMVEPIATGAAPQSGRLEGLGVSPGRARGFVRVLTDPARGETLEPGEILVCVATNPSYASYFLVAAGVVTDIGGALGHGAIVAREVGIPCVVNTGSGSRTLKTGDEIEIDGTTGAVEIITRAGPSPT